MNNQNIISNKFDLNWSTSFSYILYIIIYVYNKFYDWCLNINIIFWKINQINLTDPFKSRATVLQSFYDRNLRIFVMSCYSVCPRPAFPV
jgi:hypothetical protein